MIIDAYNTTQDVRGRSDYLTGARPGQPLRRFAGNRPEQQFRHHPIELRV